MGTAAAPPDPRIRTFDSLSTAQRCVGDDIRRPAQWTDPDGSLINPWLVYTSHTLTDGHSLTAGVKVAKPPGSAGESQISWDLLGTS